MYSALVGIGALAGAIGWYVVRSRIGAAEAQRSKVDAKHKKRLMRGGASEEAEPAADRRPRPRAFGRR